MSTPIYAHHGARILADVVITPNGNAVGAAQIQEIINSVALYAELGCAAGFLASAIVWAVGGKVGNYGAAQGGKTGVVVAVGVAFLVGAAAAIINFFFHLGQAVK